MKRFLLSILFFVGVFTLANAQTTFTSVTDGFWSDGPTWGNAGTVRGVDFPGPNDNAVIRSGNTVELFNQIDSVNNLEIEANAQDALIKSGFASSGQLTINGKLSSFIETLAGPPCCQTLQKILTAPQNSNIIGSQVIFNFRGSGEKFAWGSAAPFNDIQFDLETNSASFTVIDAGDSIIFSSDFRLLSGSLSDNADISVNIFTTGSTLNVSSGTIFNLNNPVRDIGKPEESISRLPSITIEGTVNLTQSTSYINSENFTLGDGANFNVNFNGTGQDEGWWYGTAAPSVFNLDINSNINFTANASQNIFAISSGYGNLNLNASSIVTKTLTGSGSQLVKGDFSIQSGSVTFASSNSNPITFQGNISNEGNWTTTQRVNFTGTNNQVINGSNPITFGEEVRIDKSSGNVTLQLVDQTINSDLRILQGTFRPLARTVTLSGNIINDGTIEATQNGTGGFVFDGTTEISSPGGTGVTQFRNATINSGATLSLATGNEIDLTTNFTNNGTFTHNEGLVRFTQSGAKNISGTSKTSFFNLEVDGTGTVNVVDSVDLENTMTFVGSPTVDFDGGANNGAFTLKSSETRDAAIGNVGSATLQGDATVERAIYTLRPDGQGYHLMGFPLNGVTVADVQNEIGITGSFTGADTGFSGDGYASVFNYNESLGGGINSRFEDFPVANNTETFTNGTGYFVFTYTGEAPTTIDGRGTVFSGDFDTNITLTAGPTAEDGGWNLIANPYPAATDWAQWTKPTVEGGSAHLYNVNAEAYEVITSGNIPQGQAFYVRATADGVLSATEASKVTGSTPTFYRQSPEEKFKIGLDNGTYEDITYVGFKENATDAYEGEYDASRFLNNNETISTLSSDNKKLKINQLAKSIENSCQRSIFISLEGMKTNVDYTLNFHDLDLIGQYDFTLKDHFLDETIELDNLSSYQFNVTTAAASKGSTRFEIIFDNKSPNAISVKTKDVCPSENAFIDLQQSDNWANYLVYKGEEVVASAEGTGSKMSIEVLNEFLGEASNDFEIKAFTTGCDTVSVGNATVQVSESLTLNNTVEGSSICRAETQAFFSVATQINASYFILNGTDTIQSFDGNGNVYEGFINSDELEDGLNEFTISTTKDGCQSGTLAQALEIEVQNPTIDEAITFSANNTCLKSGADISFTGQSGVVYKIFKGTTLLHTIMADGSEQTIGISNSNLTLGTNEFTVNAELGECAKFEFPEPIQIEVEENINANLSLLNENICGDASTSIVIENAQAGKVYTLQSAGENIRTLTATEDGELVFNLNPNQLVVGLNEFDIEIEGEYCGVVTSTNNAQITMYEPINTNLDYSTNSSCSQAEVLVGIQNAQVNKTYYLYKGNTLIETVQAIEGGNIAFEDANGFLDVGQNEFTVKIESEGCGTETAPQALRVELFEEINSQLEISSTDVCYGEDVVISIGNPQTNKFYSLRNTEGVITSKLAESTEALSFTISSDQYAIGSQEISVEISDDNCGTVEANSTSFMVFESINTALSYLSANTCNVSEAVVGVQNAQAGKTYKLYKGETLVETVEAFEAGSIVFESANNAMVVGQNEFTVKIESEGCGIQNASQTLSIELFEEINSALELTSSDVCYGEDVVIVIGNPQTNKSYSLRNTEGVITSKLAESTEALSFTISSEQFAIGSQEISVEISDDNCGTVEANSTSFTVFESINTALSYLSANTCNVSEAVVGIQNAQAGKTYKLYKGETLVENVEAAESGNLIFQAASNNLEIGLNEFNVEIGGEACGTQTAATPIQIELFEAINTDLDVNSVNICKGEEQFIEILNPQINKTYRILSSSGVELDSKMAESESTLVFTFAPEEFGVGVHELVVEIVDDNCGTLNANSKVSFEVFESAIISDIENQQICVSESLTIDLSSNVPMDSYQLFVGDDLVLDESTTVLNLSPEETTTYTLTGTTITGCSVNTLNFTVEVLDLVTPGILVSSNVLESSVEGDSYQWYLNGEILEGETGKILVAQETGDYTVEVSKATCTKISDAYTFSEEVLNANKALANAVHLYPNPVKDVLNIDMNNIKEIEATVFTLSGKFMDKMNLNSDKRQFIDMSKFSKGTYLIQLKSGKGTITKRIIKQ